MSYELNVKIIKKLLMSLIYFSSPRNPVNTLGRNCMIIYIVTVCPRGTCALGGKVQDGKGFRIVFIIVDFFIQQNSLYTNDTIMNVLLWVYYISFCILRFEKVNGLYMVTQFVGGGVRISAQAACL